MDVTHQTTLKLPSQETSICLLFRVSMPLLTREPQTASEKNLLSTFKLAEVFISFKFKLLTLRKRKQVIYLFQAVFHAMLEVIYLFTCKMHSELHWGSKSSAWSTLHPRLWNLHYLTAYFSLYSSEVLHFFKTNVIPKVPVSSLAFWVI